MTRYVVLCLLLLIACGTPDRKTGTSDLPPAAQSPGRPPVGSPPGSPLRSPVSFAKGFTIDYFDRYKLVKILNRSAASTDTLDFLLLPAGVAVPPGHGHAQVIRIPVQSM